MSTKNAVVVQLVRQSFQRSQLPSTITHNYYLSFKNISEQQIKEIVDQIQSVETTHQEQSVMKLHFYSNCISNRGCQSLSQKTWNNLRYLNLNDNGICDKGCRYLSKSRWVNLQEVLFSSNNISNEGCRYLSKSNWPNLHLLSLKSNRITTFGCRQLVCGKFSTIKLNINKNDIGWDEYLMFKKRGWNFFHDMMKMQTI